MISEYPARRKEILYYLACGSFKVKDYSTAKQHVDALLQVDPSNRKATSLRDRINQQGNHL